MAMNSELEWIGMQIRGGGDQIPTWDNVRLQWYVRSVDRYYNDFNLAVNAAMGRKPKYREINPKGKFLPRQ